MSNDQAAHSSLGFCSVGIYHILLITKNTQPCFKSGNQHAEADVCKHGSHTSKSIINGYRFLLQLKPLIIHTDIRRLFLETLGIFYGCHCEGKTSKHAETKLESNAWWRTNAPQLWAGSCVSYKNNRLFILQKLFYPACMAHYLLQISQKQLFTACASVPMMHCVIFCSAHPCYFSIISLF